MRIFVGNLLFTSTQEDVKKLFEPFGTVISVLIHNKAGENPRAFGFVEMPDGTQALAAITALEGKDFWGRILNVAPEREKVKKPKALATAPTEEIEELPEIKEKKVYPKRPRTGPWGKRKGRGKGKGWKKKPGGVRKKE